MLLRNIFILLLSVCLFGQGGVAKHGSSLDFNGSTGCIELDGLTSTAQSYTLEFWIKTTSITEGYLFDTESGRLIIAIGYKDSLAFYSDSWQGLYPIISLVNNNWHHIVITLDKNASLAKCYVNGDSVNAKTYDAYRNIGNTTALCTRYSQHEYFWKGKLGEAKIFERVLTVSEIQWNYRHPKECYSTTNLLAWYKLNEFTGTIAGDSSGNSNDGTIIDATWNIDTSVISGKQ